MDLKDNYNTENFTVVLQPFFSGTEVPLNVTSTCMHIIIAAQPWCVMSESAVLNQD